MYLNPSSRAASLLSIEDTLSDICLVNSFLVPLVDFLAVSEPKAGDPTFDHRINESENLMQN